MSQGFVNANSIGTTTGSGNIVRQSAPTINQPLIQGVTNGASAAAGEVGQFVYGQLLYASRISLTTSTPANVTSISLTAGDWDVVGNINFNYGSTTGITCFAQISTTSADPMNENSLFACIYSTGIGGNQALNAPLLRVSISSTTTVYLVALGSFSTGSMQVCGQIQARRRR